MTTQDHLDTSDVNTGMKIQVTYEQWIPSSDPKGDDWVERAERGEVVSVPSSDFQDPALTFDYVVRSNGVGDGNRRTVDLDDDEVLSIVYDAGMGIKDWDTFELIEINVVEEHA